MRVEYLILIDSKESYCKSVNSLNNLLQAYDEIKIDGDSISYCGNAFHYEVSFEEIGKEHQRYFHIRVTNSDTSTTQEFRTLLKSLRTILTKIGGRPPEIVWDEIGSQLCVDAYPLVHQTENLLRKLITKFMLASVGIGWTKEAIPREVVESVKGNTSETNQNYLHELDFIQLSNLLFKDYTSGDTRKIIKKIEEAEAINEIDLAELKELVPNSNWERYFSPIVDCDSNYLKKRWDRLYELRCKVAHNRFITPEEFEEIRILTSDVDGKLQQALDNLDKIEVSDEQKEEVAINAAATTNELFAEFLWKWEELNDWLKHLDMLIAKDEKELEKIRGNKNWRNLSNFAIKKGVLPKKTKNFLMELFQFRNAIVHHPDVKFSDSSVYERLGMIDRLTFEISDLYKQIELDMPNSEVAPAEHAEDIETED